MENDFEIAIKLAEEHRDELIERLVSFFTTGMAYNDEFGIKYVNEKAIEILKANDEIKLLKDAYGAVVVYKRNQETNP